MTPEQTLDFVDQLKETEMHVVCNSALNNLAELYAGFGLSGDEMIGQLELVQEFVGRMIGEVDRLYPYIKR